MTVECAATPSASLRAQRSNPYFLCRAMDCFVAKRLLAMTWRERWTTAVDGALSLQQIPAGRTCRGAVLAERLDDVLADLPLVHLVRTIDQTLRAHLRVPFGE